MSHKVIIISLNYNQNNYTIDCMKSLLNSNYLNFKIILIDNGSTNDNYQELKKELPITENLILQRIKKNIGYVGGVNYGLEIADKFSPDYFVIINNDTLIDKVAINELVRASIVYNNKAIVTGKVYHYDQPNTFQDIGYSFYNEAELTLNKIGMDEEDIGQYDKMEERDLIDDIFWLFSNKLYKEIGGYSPYFWFNGEQADFALRAKQKGYKLVYAPLAKLWHKGSVSIGGRDRNPKQAYWTTQSKLILRYLHLNKFQFLKHYLKTVYGILGTYIKTIIKKSNKQSINLEYPNAKFQGFMYFNSWFFKRNKNTGKNPFNKIN